MTLSASILASDIAQEGTTQITVFNPPPGGGTSNAVTFTIDPEVAPVPVLSSLEPATVLAGGARFTLTVNGSNFLHDSMIQLNSGNTVTTFVSFAQLQTTVWNVELPFPTTFQVTVKNFPPGGGISNALELPVVPGQPPLGEIERVSLANDGTQGNSTSFMGSISADGRFVVFGSRANNLVEGDTNLNSDVFVRDTCVGAPPGCVPSTVRVSISSDGSEAGCPSGPPPGLSCGSSGPSITADGRFIAFSSAASNLVPGDLNDLPDIFLHDRDVDADGIFDEPGAIATILVSLASDGSQANRITSNPVTSANGRFVAFESFATNLVPGDTNGLADVFVRDTCLGAPPGCTPSTLRVSRPGEASVEPSISANGRFVAFTTLHVSGVTFENIFVRDTCLGAPGDCTPSTLQVSVSDTGIQANNNSAVPSISADGRFVAFVSGASNLVPGDFNGVQDIFVHDTCLGAPSGCTPSNVLVSLASDGTQANAASFEPSISPDGRFVAFLSAASNLAPADTNGRLDFFVRDTCLEAQVACTPSTLRVSVANDGTQSTGEQGISGRPVVRLSRDGRFAAFASDASNLVPDDTNRSRDIFRARTGF